MIRSIEALNFRCLRYVRQPLGRFHVLVGPNASGKTTFLDVVGFLSRLVADGIDAAVNERTQNFEDLLWGRKGSSFDLAIEAAIPPDRQARLTRKEFDTIRYEVCIGLLETGEFGILEERALLKAYKPMLPKDQFEFPVEPTAPRTILTGKSQNGHRTVLSKARKGNDNFYSEVLEESGKGWYPSIRLGPHKSALANLHEDESRFPVSAWLKQMLSGGVQNFVLNSLLIRKPTPPGPLRGFKPDGSNLPWVVSELAKHPARFREWVSHLQTALPELEDIRTVERPEDKHRYVVLCYAGGLQVPSWMASDGTLRLLALTLPAYLPEFKGVYLIEEPENGIHPCAAETVFQSLSSVYDAQILLASHSPVILSLADADKVLCFKKTASGATNIILGSKHPALRDWKGETSLGTLFAGGVLG
jgi:predicted ATPase